MKSSSLLVPVLLATLTSSFGLAQAATPAVGTLTPTSGPVTYSSGPFTSANPTPVPLLDTGPTCDTPAPACDSFELTVSLPAGYVASHNADSIKVTVAWDDVGAGASDYDLWIYTGVVGATEGTQTPNYRGPGGANPETTNIFPLLDGDNIYTIKIVPYTPTGETVTTTIELVSATGVVTDPNFGKPDPVAANVSRYQINEPFGLTAEAGNGECNIGFNPLTFKIMFMCFGNGSVYRLTTPERLPEPLPEACQAVWEDVTPIATSGPQPVADPILFTDNISGRTWVSNLTAGPNISYAFTDNDGDLWVEAGGGGVAGADHQTIGSGPYPAGFALPHPLHENAVYFCSQAIAGPAGCVRSDDGGITYPITALAYDGSLCGGLHGHVRVAPDGTVWLPVANCGTGTGYAISTDAGVNWTDHVVPNTLGGGGSDPTISLDDENTAYFCYTNGDGHIRAATSRDRGATWENDTDLGLVHGIKNSAFPQSWAGSPGRAACAFYGTDRQGNIESIDFPGLWYSFIAHTYDGGKTWTTRIITPNDPIQGIGGIWQSGGSNPNRNLLDFNEATMDDKGRFIFGYDDGCVRDCAKDPLANPQSFTAMMTMARQSGGKTLRAEFDQPEPRAPANACLAGTRGKASALLTWREPDHGGAAISNYRVFRSALPGAPGVFIGDAGAKAQFRDTSVDSSVEKYYYTVTAVNASGEGVASNLIELPIVEEVIESPCIVPGTTILEDAANDIFAIAGSGTPVQSNTPFYDVRRLSISQPVQPDGSFKLYFHLKMASLANVPPNSTWPINFCSPAFECSDVNVATSPSNKYYTVRMRTGNSSTPVFELLSPNAADATRTTVAALPESSFAPDGTITIAVNGADLGLTSAGASPEALRNFLVRIAINAQAQNPTPDNMPDGVAGAGSYTPVSNAFCLAPPGNPGTGNPPPVTPLPVTTPISGGRFGGSLGLLALLPLAFSGLRRRRR